MTEFEKKVYGEVAQWEANRWRWVGHLHEHTVIIKDPTRTATITPTII